MEVIETDLTDPRLRGRYDDLFEACPNAFIQQSTYWAEIIRDLGPDKPIFLLCRDNDEDVAGLPLYLYERRPGNILTSVPQPGPLGGIFFRAGLSRDTIERIYAALLERALHIAQETRCMTLTIITNPFIGDLELYRRYLSPTFVFENFTQYIPVEEAVAGGKILLRAYNRRSNLSRNVRKTKGAGFSVVHCESEEDLEAWYRIHEARHKELGVLPLELGLFQRIRRVLEPRGKAYVLLVKKGDEVASGGVYIYHRAVMDAFMLSMDRKYAEQAPNFLNTEASLLWAGKAGVRIYNWQSSPDRKGGVYRYKEQWGSAEAVYYYVTRLLSEPERIQRMGLETVRAEFPRHYVVP